MSTNHHNPSAMFYYTIQPYNMPEPYEAAYHEPQYQVGAGLRFPSVEAARQWVAENQVTQRMFLFQHLEDGAVTGEGRLDTVQPENLATEASMQAPRQALPVDDSDLYVDMD